MEHRDNYTAAAAQARALFAGYDHTAIAKKLGARLDDCYLYTNMLSRDYRIHRGTGEISACIRGSWSSVDGFNETLTLLDLVCDSREDRFLTGRWKNMSSFGHQFHQTLLEPGRPLGGVPSDAPGGVEMRLRKAERSSRSIRGLCLCRSAV